MKIVHQPGSGRLLKRALTWILEMRQGIEVGSDNRKGARKTMIPESSIPADLKTGMALKVLRDKRISAPISVFPGTKKRVHFGPARKFS